MKEKRVKNEDKPGYWLIRIQAELVESQLDPSGGTYDIKASKKRTLEWENASVILAQSSEGLRHSGHPHIMPPVPTRP